MRARGAFQERKAVKHIDGGAPRPAPAKRVQSLEEQDGSAAECDIGGMIVDVCALDMGASDPVFAVLTHTVLILRVCQSARAVFAVAAKGTVLAFLAAGCGGLLPPWLGHGWNVLPTQCSD